MRLTGSAGPQKALKERGASAPWISRTKQGPEHSSVTMPCREGGVKHITTFHRPHSYICTGRDGVTHGVLVDDAPVHLVELFCVGPVHVELCEEGNITGECGEETM